MFDYDKYYKNSTGHIIQVYQECEVDDCSNPMNLDTLFNYYTWQRKYKSMQEHSYKEVDDWFDALTSEGAYYLLKEQAISKGKTLKEFVNMLCDSLDKVGIVAFPIRTYEHSSITYYLGDWLDRWEGNLVGFAWQTKEELYKEYDCKRISSELRQELKSNVKETLKDYTHFCNGEVYGYNVFDCKGEEIDGGSGFIANTEEKLLEYIIDYLPSEIIDTHFVEFTAEEAEELVA